MPNYGSKEELTYEELVARREEYWTELKKRYVYENGEVYKKRPDGTKGTMLKKHTGTGGRGFYWTLKGLRQYESDAKELKEQTP
jgi:hypothetical protein